MANNYNTLDSLATNVQAETPKTFTFTRTTFDTNGSDLWENRVAGKLTGYANERGELRSQAYDATSVAARFKSNSAGDNTSVNVIEGTLSDSTVKFSANALGDVTVVRNLAVGGDAGVSGLAIANLFAGAWWALPMTGATNTSTALAASTAYLIPIVVTKTGSLSNLGIEITTTDTGTVRFGLASDSAGQPSDLARRLRRRSWPPATGLVSPAGPVSTVLTAGVRYYLGIVPQGGTGTLAVRGRNTTDPRVPVTVSGGTPTVNVVRNAWVSTAAFAGALSGSITLAAVANGPGFFAKI
jgi:hypothetical protein